MARNSSPVAFVLSGGAGLGAIQVGMLRALYERGIEPDLIVATSAGAVNGAFIATRAPSVETADDLGSIWRRVRRGDAFPLSPLGGLLGLLVAGWLGGIIVNLLIVGGYGDIALRDFGLLLGALTLARLASAVPARDPALTARR